MYVSMYVYMLVCMYTFVHVCMYVCTYVCMYVSYMVNAPAKCHVGIHWKTLAE